MWCRGWRQTRLAVEFYWGFLMIRTSCFVTPVLFFSLVSTRFMLSPSEQLVEPPHSVPAVRFHFKSATWKCTKPNKGAKTLALLRLFERKAQTIRHESGLDARFWTMLADFKDSHSSFLYESGVCSALPPSRCGWARPRLQPLPQHCQDWVPGAHLSKQHGGDFHWNSCIHLIWCHVWIAGSSGDVWLWADLPHPLSAPPLTILPWRAVWKKSQSLKVSDEM